MTPTLPAGSAAAPLDLSITVVSHGHQALLERYLPSLFDVPTSVAFEVLLIDNTGSDGAADWVSRRFSHVHVVRNERPRSFAANMNTGMRMLRRGRYFVVFNPDIQCLPGLFEECVRFMDTHPDVGLIGPQLLNPDGTVQPSCRRFATPLVTLIRGLGLDSRFGERAFVGRSVRRYLMSDSDHDRVMDVDWVTGALMVARREALADVGGMDERYEGAYAEDADLCCQLWQAGWRVSYVPQAKAIHDHQRAGVRRPLSRMQLLQLTNTVRAYRKFGWKLTRELQQPRRRSRAEP